MKIHSTILTIILISMLAMAGCAPAAQPAETQAASVQPAQAQAPEPQTTPTQPLVSQATPTADAKVEVVLKMVERLNAGDVDGSLAYFAEDALSYFVGMPPTGMEIYRGAEALRPMWEYCVDDHFEWEVEITQVTGDLVFAKAKTWLDFTRGLGVAPNEFSDVYQVKDGKITTYGSTITEDALAEFKPALYKAMPPEPTAVPSSDPPVSEMTVTIADGTCTTDLPAALQAGEVTVRLNVEDQEKSMYALYLFNLDPGKDIVDLMASTLRTYPPPWSKVLLGEELGPGKSATYTFTVEQGPVYLICFSKPPELTIGNAGPIEVVTAPETPPPPERGESDILLTFADKQCTYEGPAVLSPGTTNVIMNMQGLDKYKIANALMFFTLEPGYNLNDLLDKLWMTAPPDWAKMIFMHEAYPGEVTYNDLVIDTGPLYYVCLSGESEDTARLVGKGGPLEVGP